MDNLMEKFDSLRCEINDRVEELKPKARQRMMTMRDNVKGRIDGLQSRMKSNPGKWAGIAAGAGLGAGIIGRILRHRARMRSEDLPQIVIVGAC